MTDNKKVNAELSKKTMSDLVQAARKPRFSDIMACIARATDRDMCVLYAFASRMTDEERGSETSADTNIQIVDKIMGCITQTDVWFDAQQNDPAITAAKARRDKVLEQVEALIPRDLYVELEDATMGESSATCDAGILYGMRVAFALSDVASRPSDLSRHILSRMGVSV